MAKRSTSPAQTWVAATDSPPEPALPDPLPQLPKAGTRPADPVQLLLPVGFEQAPTLDLMCSQFVLALATRLGPRFDLRSELVPLIGLTGRHWVWPLGVLQRLRAFLQRRCGDSGPWQGQSRLDDRAWLNRFGRWLGPYEEGSLFFHLDDYAREAPKDLRALLASASAWLDRHLGGQDCLLERNIAALGELLQLNPAERALLRYGTLARYQRELRALLLEFKVGNAHEAYAAIAEVAGAAPEQLADALRAGSRLERLGLLENLLPEHHITDLADLMKVSERLPPVLLREYRDRQELMAVFTRPAPRSELGLADFDFVREDAALLCALLRSAVARQEIGVNLLLYGPPGTGKTELARVLAQAAGLELFEVECADREGHALSGRDRYRSLQIAQVFLQGSARSALLFDEVEDVFPALDGAAGRPGEGRATAPGAGGKGWLNQLLEHNPVPTLWVTNRIEQIDPAVRRRFAYHLELGSPPPGAREQLVRKALEGVPSSPELVARLAGRSGLTPAQIGTAVRFARLVAGDGGAQAGPAESTEAAARRWDELIERQLRQADLALGRRQGAASRQDPLRYGLEWLNTESRHELPRIIEALRARGHGSLCLHGVPGSGKTALAEQLAQALGRPLLRRQASDLLGKFVGETEQAMAAMFAEAEAEQALLLLDEADSFLLDRRGAQRHHELSEVNEMLQGMERFRGIFVCTTNLLERIDAAALRRFSFKILFKPLRPEQRLALFAREALGAAEAPLEPAWRARLLRLDQLCLGDYAAVRRQLEILQEALDPEGWLEQLEAEHRLKPEVRERRSIGF